VRAQDRIGIERWLNEGGHMATDAEIERETAAEDLGPRSVDLADRGGIGKEIHADAANEDAKEEETVDEDPTLGKRVGRGKTGAATDAGEAKQHKAPTVRSGHGPGPTRSALECGDSERNQIMLCYSCAEQGIHQPAVAVCRSCTAGLCMDHLRETAAHFASDNMLSHCHHDTWTVTEHPRVTNESLRPRVDA
jgi:hypothetical protein